MNRIPGGGTHLGEVPPSRSIYGDGHLDRQLLAVGLWVR